MAGPISSREQLVASLAPAVRDPRVLTAIAAVPRERFVPEPLRERAWENVALPIACEQTISQPLVVARMLELLELDGSERVLDVGTGSGYHAALLGRLARQVVSIERHAPLASAARQVLAALAVDNVEVQVADGSRGWPPGAPFDAINVAAAAGDRVPGALVAQLARAGRLVAPVTVAPAAVAPDGRANQQLVLLRRDTDRGRISGRVWEAVRFVPLVAGPPPASAPARAPDSPRDR